MFNERPSTRQMVLTLVGWVVGLLVVFGLIFALATALAPKTPPAPVESPGLSSETVVPSSLDTETSPVAVVPSTPPAPAPVYTPPPSAPVTRPAPKTSKSSSNTRALSGKVVVIDAGHQARGDSSLEPIGPGSSTKKPKVTTGTSGVSTRNAESAINLSVALKLEKVLESRGVTVVMVRTKQSVNIANSARAAVANRERADLFIRLHCDGVDNRSANGLSTLVPATNQWTRSIVAESRKAGEHVHREVIAETGAHSRGVIPRSDMSGFNYSKVPALIVEMGFMSNPAEDVKLGTTSYQNKLAKGLADGIESYLKTK